MTSVPSGSGLFVEMISVPSGATIRSPPPRR
jgi:hypothetical protein